MLSRKQATGREREGMKVYGNLNAVKEAIRERYGRETSAIGKEIREKQQLLRGSVEAELRALEERLSAEAENEAQQAYQRVFNERKSAAKRQFEGEREALIESVLSEAGKEAEKFAEGKQYLEFVKRNMPGKGRLEAFGGSEAYKAAFPGMKIDKSLRGIVFRGEGVEYNFTADRIMEARREELRRVATAALFGE